MPVNVIPAAVLLRDLISRAIGDEVKTSDNLPTSTALRWLAEGYQEINRRTKILRDTFTGNLAAAVSQTGPTDILDRLVASERAMLILDAAGSESYPNERDWEYLRATYGAMTFPNGETGPVDWAWDESADAQSFALCPPPAAAVNNGLIFDYVKDPGPLDRIYDPDELEATISVTNGSAAVNASVNLTGLLSVGDVMGVKESDDVLPTSWYKVLSIQSLALGTFTLTENYAGTTDSTALFTLSQVSPMEYKRPGLCRFAPVEWALYKWWEQQEGKQDMSAFDAEIARIALGAASRVGRKLAPPKPYNQFPSLRNKV